MTLNFPDHHYEDPKHLEHEALRVVLNKLRKNGGLDISSQQINRISSYGLMGEKRAKKYLKYIKAVRRNKKWAREQRAYLRKL